MPQHETDDLEACQAPVFDSRQATCQRIKQCAIALHYFDGSCYLTFVDIVERENRDLLFNSVQKHLDRILVERWYHKCFVKVFIKNIVGIAEVRQVMLSTTQTPTPSCRVHLQGFALDTLLTEAFHDPRILFRGSCSRVNDISAAMAATKLDGSLEGQHIIVVRRVVDKVKISWILISLLVISPSLGIVVGICSHNADVGVAASAGVFALATFVQGLAAWVQG